MARQTEQPIYSEREPQVPQLEQIYRRCNELFAIGQEVFPTVRNYQVNGFGFDFIQHKPFRVYQRDVVLREGNFDSSDKTVSVRIPVTDEERKILSLSPAINPISEREDYVALVVIGNDGQVTGELESDTWGYVPKRKIGEGSSVEKTAMQNILERTLADLNGKPTDVAVSVSGHTVNEIVVNDDNENVDVKRSVSE